MTEAVGQGFCAEGARWCCRGTLTMATSAALLRQSEALPLPASGAIDLSSVQEADSSALAVFMALLRRADREGKKLQFEGVPPVLRTLAHVYGVDTLLMLSAESTSASA